LIVGWINSIIIIMPSSSVETECKKESYYRTLFTKLIQKHAGIIQISPGKSNRSSNENKRDTVSELAQDNFEAENKLILNAISAERNAVFAGFFVGVAAFVTFRYGPAHLVKKIGGEKKARALREAEEATRKDSYGWVKRGVALSFETLFGLWAGSRGYEIVSKEITSKSSGASNYEGDRNIFKDISRIPLVEGRSIVAETICDEWIDVAYNQTPRNFWKNVQIEKENGNSGLKDPRAWTAIADFAINCQKRNAYSKIIREHERLADDVIIDLEVQPRQTIIPSPGVPIDTSTSEDLFSDSVELSEQQAGELSMDQ